MNLRILVLGDTHLGFDESLSPRVRRRRRGPDFMASFKAALVPALRREVDAVIHLGDVFHRPSPPPSLVFQAFRLLEPVVASGIPVFVVPGNHERGR
ncbi:MAG: metallophosphoesterase, partial [Gemmatimonadota bacterium]|nr:metallophosphoesterase [Gemmatimonadota bacterium]